MAAKDVFHAAVVAALQKEGWRITDDPLVIQTGGVDLQIDLGAEQLISAERGQQYIAVEIKSFLGPSLVTDFHTALGQFRNYQLALTELTPQRHLYLAVPFDTYRTFFALPFVQRAVTHNAVSLVVYNAPLQEIAQWIP